MASLRIPTTVTFNGKELDPSIFRVEHMPDITIPERDRRTIHVEGRSGDIVIDGGSYKNVPRTYSISFGASGPSDFADKVSMISKWLDCEGYGELHDTYENEYYRLAYPSGSAKVSSLLNGRMGKVQIDFTCVPKRFLMYGKDGFKWKPSESKKITKHAKGDVDGDRFITIMDAYLALKAAIGAITLDGSTSTQYTAAWAADMDNSGAIHADDAREILRLWSYRDHTDSLILWNPTGYDSNPVILCTVNGTPGLCSVYISPRAGSAGLTIDTAQEVSRLVQIDLTGTNVSKFVIDCKRETVYEAETFKNLNALTTAEYGFPVLKAQTDSRVEFSGTINEITVYPDFWVR